MSKKESDTPAVWHDPDDGPVWTDDQLDRAELKEGDLVLRPADGTLTKRGRPKLDTPKKQVTLRLDQEVLDKLREQGPGWQSRVNELLKKAVGV
ncbi:BrnA antitoxin family protein [Caulobacter sp.]|uniref:BrnA antitoxin family protein n=1 Tax=Caulobacter sp. TaxID=78 RepID=UPI001B13428A|nr:BrnA antitoxin family protein [Caulobacter sp.]MBO9543260.1 BrnA antitoxin family protein [Caulobacter sp.]